MWPLVPLVPSVPPASELMVTVTTMAVALSMLYNFWGHILSISYFLKIQKVTMIVSEFSIEEET